MIRNYTIMVAIFATLGIGAFTTIFYFPVAKHGTGAVTTTASIRPQELAAEYIGSNTYNLYRLGASQRKLIGRYSANELAQFGVVPIGWTPEGKKPNLARLEAIRAELNR